MLSKSSSEELRTHSSWEHSYASFIQEAMEEEMSKGRHLGMRNSFSSLDDTLSMSMPQLKERHLLVGDPRPLWFWKAMHEEEVSSGDPIGGALQHFMRCKVLQRLEEHGVLPWEDTKKLQNEIHHPHWDEWMAVWSKRFPNPLQIYDTG